MRSIRAAVAAAVLIIPGLAFAATTEPSTPEKSTAEQVRPAAESDAAQQPIRESGSDSFAQVPAAAPHASSKPKTVRRTKVPVARTAAAPPFNGGCSRYWCGRQFVLILGVAY
jgi:hypothetical protein